jgi:hypothetical protein
VLLAVLGQIGLFRVLGWVGQISRVLLSVTFK